MITSVGQEYEFTKGWYNFKNWKPKYFNCKIYEYIAKDCKKLKKEKDARKCYECGWIGHIVRDCKTKQQIKKQSIQEDTDTEEEDK